ncbi:MAG: hypothetical protein CMJ18_15450, partial [Phycisphaeraceae bacterium]|nr:hypothetical protein [Phycisphaeraceae bacterium]
ADWYRFSTDFRADFNFDTTSPEGEGAAGFELVNFGGSNVEAAWHLRPDLTHTLVFTPREDGIAIDSFRLVLLPESLEADFSRIDGGSFHEGFTIDNGIFSGVGLWHLSTGRSADTTTHTSPNLLYYGQSETATGGGNYNFVGVGRTDGHVTSAEFTLAQASTARLTFNYFLETERVFGRDIARVEIGVDSDFTVVADNQFLSGFALADGSGWQTADIDLAPFVGFDEIEVRFSFDTINSINNSLEGWYIDDVEIVTTPLLRTGVDFANFQVIEAGPDQVVDEGTLISVDAQFNNPGTPGGELYQWTVTRGSDTLFTGPLGPSPSLNYTIPDDGTYVMTVMVRPDELTSYTDSFMVTANNVAPVINIGGVITLEDIPVAYNNAFTDAGSEDTHTFDWQVESPNSQVVPPGSGPTFGFTPEDDGVYWVTFTVTDDDGGTASRTVNVAAGNRSPYNVVVNGPEEVDEGSPVVLDVSFDDGALDTHVITWHVDTVVKQDIDDGTGTTFGFTPADNGDFDVTITITDDDGGETVTVFNVTGNNVPPTADAGPDRTVTEGETVLVDATRTDPAPRDKHSFLWEVSADNGQVIADGTSEDFSFVPFDDGVYTLTWTVTDDDDASDSDVVVITAVNADPTVDLGDDREVLEGDVVVIDPVVTDPGGNDTHTFDWQVVADNGQVVDPGSGSTFSFTPEDDGVYTLTLTVTDDNGGEATDEMSVIVLNAAPTVLPGVIGVVVEGDLVTAPVLALFTDAGFGAGETFTYEIDWGDQSNVDTGVPTLVGNGPGTVGSVGGTHVYADDGVFVVTITVFDDDGGVHADTLNVIVNNDVPVVSAIAGATLDAGDLLQFGGSFTDHGADSWSLFVDFLGDATFVPVPLSGQTFSISRVYDTANPVPYSLTIRVVDDEGDEGTAVVPVTVNAVPANQPPTLINPLPDLTGVDARTDSAATESIDIATVFSDPDGFTLALVSNEAVTPATTSPVTARLLGSGPTARIELSYQPGQTGTAQITIRATDPGGLSTTEQFLVEVVPGVAQAPRIVDVRLKGSNWPQPFLDQLGTDGYRRSTGADQLVPLPLATVDQIVIEFSQDVIFNDDLMISGVNLPVYSGVRSYDAGTFTATWTLDANIGVDSILLTLPDTVTGTAGGALDGEWSEGTSTESGDGTPGGVFTFRFNVVPGDTDGNLTVGTGDLTTVLANFTQSVPVGEFLSGDVAGASGVPDGVIGSDDLLVVLANFTRSVTPPPARSGGLDAWQGWNAVTGGDQEQGVHVPVWLARS